MTPRARGWTFIAVLLLVYIGAVIALDGLTFPPTKDERHFWPTSLAFSREFPPSVETLRGYDELNTPLPFVVFGALEHFFQGGIVAGRLLNLAISFLMACAVGFAAGPPGSRAFLSAAGLLLFPYFLWTSAHLYTDILASFFALWGVAHHLKRRHAASAVSFMLAIASRQYAVAFPLAILGRELLLALRAGSPAARGPVWASAAALASMGGWYAFFGGFAPPAALASQRIDAGGLFVDHGLYFLACLGAYFVLVEAALFRRRFWREIPRAGRVLAPAAALAFVLFPPLQNVDFAIQAMGLLDRAARLVLADAARMAVFGVLAACTAARFSRLDLASLFVWANALVMTAAHIGWDKYALPLLVVLWYMKSAGALDVTEGRGHRIATPGKQA